MKVTVIGDGAWGTALALNMLRNGHKVQLWGAFPEYLQEIAERKENYKFLPGVTLPEELILQADIADAVAGQDMLLLATPTQFLRSVLKKISPVFSASTPVINVAKGIEIDSWKRISQIVEDELGEVDFIDLSGPSHAEEVSRKVPTAVVAAAKNEDSAKAVQKLMMNENFRVYTSKDVVGVELGGALKNVMAIAAGIIDGMNMGDNPKAAMMTRGIFEMGRLGEALGGQRSTFAGLSGIGDLIVTCCSGHSRNRHVGEELGRGKKMADIRKEMGMVVAEGVPTARGAKALAGQLGVETPIIDEIYNIIYNDRAVADAVRSLMNRDAKPEE
ncbi:MAG: NAD(P)-dependent glycerol-3-phosphate dehydrogenase [Lentisphaeria bacterium]|nr:NAD(P)-dependent glycerol-3-phosphate dehydrogenase [Lentisphaerota bacterium]MBR2626357.1 NAD(P)-dependent glycerol-3-phosphate dehydrogenase [Lentisphaeria bacterium]